MALIKLLLPTLLRPTIGTVFFIPPQPINNSLSLLFLLPILVFFLIQLKFQNYFNFLNNLDQIIKDVMIKMYILDDDSDDDDQYNYEENEPIEFFIISEIIYAMKIVSGNY